MASTFFSPKALAFLRALKRNNDREWFRARKDDFEHLLQKPMLAVIDRLAVDLREFAPDLVANRRSLYRIYRDTRFSNDKTPLKTNVAAVFPARGLGKHEGAGMYFEIAHGWVWVGGGMYAPDTPTLARVREHIFSNPRQLRSIVESPSFRRGVGRLSGEQLRRVPHGFPKDHEAAEYLRYRQFLVGREHPAAFAASPRFYDGLLATFRRIAPLIAFLNDPLLRGPSRSL